MSVLVCWPVCLCLCPALVCLTAYKQTKGPTVSICKHGDRQHQAMLNTFEATHWIPTYNTPLYTISTVNLSQPCNLFIYFAWMWRSGSLTVSDCRKYSKVWLPWVRISSRTRCYFCAVKVTEGDNQKSYWLKSHDHIGPHLKSWQRY